jgi:hypothetical protein
MGIKAGQKKLGQIYEPTISTPPHLPHTYMFNNIYLEQIFHFKIDITFCIQTYYNIELYSCYLE